MKQEIITTAKTVDAAVELGAKELGVNVEEVEYEVIEMPKKGFLGIGEAPAKVKVICEIKPEKIAINFINTIIDDMDLDSEAVISDTVSSEGKTSKNEKTIMITGEKAGILIGHHGETLDALQYLTNLAANKKEDEDDTRDYTRITVDVENYREKRVETLHVLARRMASKVLKYRKSITLEPMNPYERRIIHSEIQNIEGVSTTSIGAENNRKVVIFLEEKGNDQTAPEKSDKYSAKSGKSKSSGLKSSGYKYGANRLIEKKPRPPKRTIEEEFGKSVDDFSDETAVETTEIADSEE